MMIPRVRLSTPAIVHLVLCISLACRPAAETQVTAREEDQEEEEQRLAAAAAAADSLTFSGKSLPGKEEEITTIRV